MENNIYYNLSKDVRLYRSDSAFYITNKTLITDNKQQLNQIRLPETFTFFGLNEDDIEREYKGVIFEFIVYKEAKLLRLDNADSYKLFFTDSPREIQDILERNYGYKTKIRYSEGNNDRKLSEYLCSKGYDGYYNGVMQTQFGEFHEEIVLCNPSKHIKLNAVITPPEKIDQIILESKLIQVNKQLKNQKNKKMEMGYDDNYTKKKLFYDDDDNDSDDYIKPKKRLFDDDDDEPASRYGGRKYKTRKTKTRKTKTRKTRKTRKIRKTRKTRNKRTA